MRIKMLGSSKFRTASKQDRVDVRQRGMTLLELLIAITVLAIGMLGASGMIIAGIQSNTRNKTGSTAVVLDQEILETFATYKNYPTTGYVVMTDCGSSVASANAHNAAVVDSTGVGSGATLYTTATAPLPSQVGDINWTVAAPTLATSTVSGYAMQYETCSGDKYEVRWNITAVNPNASGNAKASLLTVSSRQVAAAGSRSSVLFSNPTTLRTLIE